MSFSDLSLTTYEQLDRFASHEQVMSEVKEGSMTVDTVLYNPFSLDAQLAGKIMACRTDNLVFSLEDNQRFRQIATSEKFGVVGLKPDIMSDLVKSKQRQKGLKFADVFEGKQEIPIAHTLAEMDVDLSDLHLKTTLFSQVIRSVNYAGFTEQAMQAIDFQIQMFEGNKDTSIDMLHNLWRFWTRLNNEIQRSEKHQATDRLRVQNAKFGKRFQLPDASERYDITDFAAFMAGLKVRLSQNYRIIGVRLGKKVHRVCLTTLPADDWAWAKRIVASAHDHYINLSTNAYLRIATGSIPEKDLKVNNIDYDVYV